MKRFKRRRPKPNAKLKTLATAMLFEAETLFGMATDLDTAVRDEVHEGLAFVVYAAFDTLAIAECVSDSDHVAFIQQKTYEWFRDKGFVEWFCAGASTLFRTTPRSFFRVKAVKARSGKATLLTREKVG